MSWIPFLGKYEVKMTDSIQAETAEITLSQGPPGSILESSLSNTYFICILFSRHKEQMTE